ncbi:phosphate/phosphite/phosphonate ABC transporter substrate-binding protein [uncultured Rhodospira sp.]|uniref:phosphate/phosphite/phosphonate ABC transporter substrate-binding protein n=1 Tax=uncultured Rhodospira sp. TaxID=1936189 RepID=UPI0026380F2A|nr:phosphate/phosphite/phosphonate ABC transporter substrate-binding protein [uncultured Rhodospira sp.]
MRSKAFLIRAFLLLALIMAGAARLAPANATEPEPLSLGFMPYLNAEHLIEKYTPLADYLSDHLDRPVRITVARNYNEHIRLTGEDRLDIAFLGGSPYVVIGERYGLKPLLVRYVFSGKPTFRSVILVDANSGVQSLADLAGKRMAFGNVNSTLSTQVPLYMLMQAGVGLGDLAAATHLRNHENVILGVRFGDFDAGAVAEEVFNEHDDGTIRALALSPDLSTHVFVTRTTMDPALRQTIATALISLRDDPRGPAILGAISPTLTGFAPVRDRDYDLHRTILADVLPVLGE